MKILFFLLTMATGSAFTGTIDDTAPNPFFVQSSVLFETTSGSPTNFVTLPMGCRQTGGNAFIAAVVGDVASGTSGGVRIASFLDIINSGQTIQSYPLACYQDYPVTNFSSAEFITGPYPTSLSSLVPFLNNFSTVPPILFRVSSEPAGQTSPYTLIALPFRVRLDFNELQIRVQAANNPPGTGTAVIAACMAAFVI